MAHRKASKTRTSRDPTPIDHDRIRQRAYEIFLMRRDGPGDALSDWLQAERELVRSAMPHDDPASTKGGRSTSRRSGHTSARRDDPDLEPLDALIERRRQARFAQVM